MWSKFMAFLATLIFIATGSAFLLALEGDFIPLSEVLSFIDRAYTDFSTRLVVIFTGLGLVILGLFNIYFALGSFRRKSYVAIRGAQGPIQIAHKTIEELVEKVRRDVGGIDKVSTRIIHGRRKISLEVRVSLGSVRNVIDISKRIQGAVKEDVERVLGITNLGEVKVFVKKITLEKGKKYDDILEQKQTSRGIELQR
ncbi:MAG: alkaline shock response membrane anchor protein AmaP [Candidatus Omnitrophica bacterium]|nr:alkaline shock response membrane anchor protein AmaP [Candidatus Omnitrophota bacterium]